MANLIKINASAGSGKTYALTRRYLRLLKEGSLTPRPYCGNSQEIPQDFAEILAITFTNLTANQMQERILSSLKRIALGDNPADDPWTEVDAAHALTMIFRHFGSLNIRTIDSLLYYLVRLSSLELGLNPRFEVCFDQSVVMGAAFDDLARLALGGEQWLARLFNAVCSNLIYQQRDFNRFLAGDFLKKDAMKMVDCFIKNDVQTEFLTSTHELIGYRDAIISQAKLEAKIFCEIMEVEGLNVHGGAVNAIKKLRDSGLMVSVYFRKESLEGILNKPKKLSSAKGKKGEFAKDKESIKDIIEDEPKNIYSLDAQYAYKRLASIAKEVEYSIPVLEKGLRYAPMAELAKLLEVGTWQREKEGDTLLQARMSRLVANVLQGEYGVNEAFCRMGSRLRHLLLDEFQDTGHDQWEALRPLAEEALAQQGSVFFVGDVKQAIYGWRGGDAKLFSSAPLDLEAMSTGYEQGELNNNWRSCEGIIAWNNAFFSCLRDISHVEKALPTLLSDKRSEQFTHDEVLRESCYECAEKIANCFESAIQIFPEQKKSKEMSGQVQMHRIHLPKNTYDAGVLSLIPSCVHTLHEKYEWQDICILTVNNKQATWISEILLSEGIPVVSSGSLLMGEHPLIAELVSLLRFLHNPLDNQAFWHVISSTYILPYTLDFSILVSFVTQKREESLYFAFQTAFPQVWELCFRAIVDGAGLMGAYDTLQDVYERWELPRRYGVEADTNAEVFLLRFLEIAHLAEKKGFMDVGAFVAWWGENAQHEKAPLPENAGAVSVMTVHKAKGLEFDAVLMPWMDFRIRVEDDIKPHNFNLSVLGEKKPVHIMSPLIQEHGKTYNDAFFNKASESLNALYVAWTRAVKELHIFLPEEKNSKFTQFLHVLMTKFHLDDMETHEDYYTFGADFKTPLVFEKDLRIMESILCGTKEEFFDIKQRADGYLKKAFNVDISDDFDMLLDIHSDDDENQSDNVQSDGVQGVILVAQTLLARYALLENSHVLQITPHTAPQIASPNISHVSPSNISQTVPHNVSQSASILPTAMYNISPTVLEGIAVAKQERPMAWLPRMKVFRSNLDELRSHGDSKELNATQRGIFMHKCLELLTFSEASAEFTEKDVNKVIQAASQALPFISSGNHANLHESLKWFTSLKNPYGGTKIWLKNGLREHGIIRQDGKLFRVDLLVNVENTLVAIDYKTGYNGELPVKENVVQMENYLQVLSDVTKQSVKGLLVYLDRQELCDV